MSHPLGPVPPSSSIESIATRIEEAFGRRAAAFADAARRTRARADAEAIHDLRVSARRLSAVLSLWRSLLVEAPRLRAARRLRRLRRAIGAAREHEVHAADLETRLPRQTLAVRLAIGEPLEQLRAEVERGRASAAKRVSVRRPERILDRIPRALEGMRGRLTATPELLADARTRLGAAEQAARAGIAEALHTLDDQPLHAARIAVKKWRYTLETFASVAGAPAGAPDLRHLRAVQEALGDVHDRAVLRDLIARWIRELRSRGLETHADALRPLTLEIEVERRAAIEAFRDRAARLEPADEAGAAGA
jgi:CHAD domain-containing protein